MPKVVYTQTEAARRLGLSVPMLNQLIKGNRGLTWKRAKKVAAIIGVPPSLLMDATPPQLRKLLLERRLE